MMKNIIATIAIMSFCITAFAQLPGVMQTTSVSRGSQTSSTTYQAHEPNTTRPEQKSLKNPVGVPQFVAPASVQVLVGSQGVGADVKYGYLPKLSGRLGFGIIPVNASKGFSFSSFPVLGQMSATFVNVHLLADYSLFNTNNIRLVGGAAYLIDGNANVLISSANGYNIGRRSINKDDIGAINAKATWKGVAPYLGAAILKGFPNGLFNMNLDIGAYYISSPGTSFTGTKLLTDNQAAAKQFNSNMRGYCWLPVLQLNFNFRIK